jgi:hypothetical protein
VAPAPPPHRRAPPPRGSHSPATANVGSGGYVSAPSGRTPWAVSGAALRGSVLPEVLELTGRKRGVPLGRDDRSMAEIALDRPCVVAVIGELIAVVNASGV